ncbi:MAG: hypothetical protein JXA11_13525 [Phycisphaerae bacterium]|nr:hypothetical protein [Phycisphaerae bacterium]
MNAELNHQERFSNVDDAPPAPVERSRRLLFGREVSRSTLLIGLMFLLGAGWVLWESRAAGPQPAAADPALNDPNITMGLDQMRMDAAIGNAYETRKQKILGPFFHDLERRRIRLLSLGRDPFALPDRKKDIAPTATTNPKPEVVAEEPPPATEDLELKSILIGVSPTAIINGYMVMEGQVISDWTVVKIYPQKVLLQWRKHQHVLKLMP